MRLCRRTLITVDNRTSRGKKIGTSDLPGNRRERIPRYSRGSERCPLEIDIDLRELNLDVCRRTSGYRRFDREVAIANSYPLAILSI